MERNEAIERLKKLESEIDDILDTPDGIRNQDELTRLRIALTFAVDALNANKLNNLEQA